MTEQHIAAKVCEYYDPLGVSSPIKAYYKRSFSSLTALDWKNPIPDIEHTFWTQESKTWLDIVKLSFNQSTVAKDAVHPLQIIWSAQLQWNAREVVGIASGGELAFNSTTHKARVSEALTCPKP